MSPLTQSPLLSLPVELIVTVCEACDAHSLTLVSQTCQMLHTVTEAPSLKFIRMVEAAEMNANPACKRPASDCLAALKSYRQGWMNASFSRTEIVPMTGGHLWELAGGILAQSKGVPRVPGKSPRESLELVRLPAPSRGVEMERWNLDNFDFHMRDFTIDPSQDLLALIEGPRPATALNRDRCVEVHVRRISTGERHPLSPKLGLLHRPLEPDTVNRFTIAISGSHIALLLIPDSLAARFELVVWNWSTGVVEMCLCDRRMDAFVFLDEQHIMVSALAESAPSQPSEYLLKVFNFVESPKKRSAIASMPHVLAYRFPTLEATVEHLYMVIRADPSPAYPVQVPPDVPFYNKRRNRIYVVGIAMFKQGEPVPRWFTVFVPLSTLLTPIETMQTDEGELLVRGDVLAWHDWGQRGALLRRIRHMDMNWVCMANGMRCVFPVVETRGILLLDFTPAAKEKPNGEKNFWVERSISSRWDGFFKDEVESYLPHRQIIVEEPIHDEEHLMSVMITEDHILSVCSASNNQDGGEFGVFCI